MTKHRATNLIFILAAALLFITPSVRAQQFAGGKDYLPPDLRARVEQLKKEVASGATTRENIEARMGVLWDWANAYAMQGGVLPVELPLIVGIVFSREGKWTGINMNPLVYLDRYVHELDVKERNPNAVGTLTSDGTKPMVAGTYQTIAQTYTVGDMGMAVGGGVLIARHFMSNQGQPYQADDPKGDDYITIKSSNAGAKFKVESEPMGGMHGGFRGAVETLVFRLEGAPLAKGDTVTVTYGDRSGGSQGFRIQTFSNDRFPLPIYVDLEGKKNFFTLPIFAHKVIGGAATGVHGFAPSIIKTGEPFEISIRSEDRFSNRASGAIPGYDVTVNGKPFKSIPAGEQPITLLSDIKFDQPGIYRFGIRTTDGKLTGDTNPVWVQENPKNRIYWGEMHGHCGYAEGQGTPDGFFTFGRDDARLDFLTLTEHDLWMDDFEWKTLADKVREYHKEGSFITILGHEWTQDTELGGHHNVFFRTPDNRKRANIQRVHRLSSLYQTLRAENDLKDVLVIPHAHEAGDWRMNDPELEKLIEIMSMHGTFQWYGEMFLNRGYEMGFVAASDDHLSHPGYSGPLPRGLFQRGGIAAVIAPSKTNDAIFDALKSVSTYATTNERIILDVSLNGGRMGSRVPLDKTRKIVGKAIGTAPIDSITIFKNGKPVWDQNYMTAKDGKSNSVLVSFYSDSFPKGRANPRAMKTWSGYLTVEGAKLKSARLLRPQNVYAEKVQIDPAQPNKVAFTICTRGRDQSILLQLDGAGPNTSIDLNLSSGVELTPKTALYEVIARTPASKHSFRMKDMKEGAATENYPVLTYTDRITVRTVNLDVPMEEDFSYTDTDEEGEGDYYFTRVTQLGEGMAWSSPIWVGGFQAK